MRKFLALIAFLGGLVATIIALFRKLQISNAPTEPILQQKKEEVKQAEAALENKKLEVEAQLAHIDKMVAEERAKDTVDVANDIIGS